MFSEKSVRFMGIGSRTRFGTVGGVKNGGKTMAANYADERKRLAGRLKQYHDWNFTPGVYDHSILGLAAKLLEVDAVEVVRCKDCKWRQQDDVKRNFCGLGDFYCGDTDFCSRGERKDNG
jgi:hypothetical protein